MSEERALTWSKKWHIINPDHPDAHLYTAAIARCGAYVYRNDDPRYPQHLRDIQEGRKKDAGLCKICAKSAKVTSVTVELKEELHEETARNIAKSVGMENNLPALQEYGRLMISAYEVLQRGQARKGTP